MGVNLSTFPADLPAEVFEGLKLAQVARYYTIAILAVGVYDWMISFYKEYNRIWKAEWSWVKFLYFITRYWGLATISFATTGFTSNWDAETCARLNRLEPGLAVIAIMAGETILVIRVIALWQRNKYIIAGLTSMLIIEAAVIITATFYFIPVPEFPGVKNAGCFAAGQPSGVGKVLSILFWGVPSIGATILFGLTVYKARQFWNQSQNQTTPILTVITRDGTIYFVIVFLVNLLNLVFYAGKNIGLQPINSPMAIMVQTILVCRLVLNLRAEGVSKPPRAMITSGLGVSRDPYGPNKSVISHAINIHPNQEFETSSQNTFGGHDMDVHEMGGMRKNPGGVQVDIEKVVEVVGYEKSTDYDESPPSARNGFNHMV